MTRTFIAYLRVSTIRPGQTGVSLQEQRRAIEEYARLRDLRVIEWCTEMESAARKGRTVFQNVVERLRRRNDLGLLLHRIDRGARNLWDWAKIGDLIDRGVDVRFVHDGLDLQSRGGRLAADIQAVVAADYIRNLRDEARKGIDGRFRQGLFPFAAPVGYLNCGRGKPKRPDPDRAAHIHSAFELYSTGMYNLKMLSSKLSDYGFRTGGGRAFSRTCLSRMLRNRFYIGLIVARSGDTFQGVHEPLIERLLFDRVQNVLHSRCRQKSRSMIHSFLYRRRLRCRRCQHLLVGEVQKRKTYYRCHAQTCRGVCVREDRVEANLRSGTAFSLENSNPSLGQRHR